MGSIYIDSWGLVPHQYNILKLFLQYVNMTFI